MGVRKRTRAATEVVIEISVTAAVIAIVRAVIAVATVTAIRRLGVDRAVETETKGGKPTLVAAIVTEKIVVVTEVVAERNAVRAGTKKIEAEVVVVESVAATKKPAHVARTVVEIAKKRTKVGISPK